MAMSSMNREAADLIKKRLSDAHFNIETEAKRLKDYIIIEVNYRWTRLILYCHWVDWIRLSWIKQRNE